MLYRFQQMSYGFLVVNLDDIRDQLKCTRKEFYEVFDLIDNKYCKFKSKK